MRYSLSLDPGGARRGGSEGSDVVTAGGQSRDVSGTRNGAPPCWVWGRGLGNAPFLKAQGRGGTELRPPSPGAGHGAW